MAHIVMAYIVMATRDLEHVVLAAGVGRGPRMVLGSEGRACIKRGFFLKKKGGC